MSTTYYVRIPLQKRQHGKPSPTQRYTHSDGRAFVVDAEPRSNPLWYGPFSESYAAELRGVDVGGGPVFEVLSAEEWERRVNRPVEVTVVGGDGKATVAEKAPASAPASAGRADVGTKAPKPAPKKKAPPPAKKKAPAAAKPEPKAEAAEEKAPAPAAAAMPGRKDAPPSR